MASATIPEFLSVEEYLSAEGDSFSKSEYIEGWIRAMVGSTIRDNLVKRNCLVLVSRLLKGLPSQPFDSDTKLRIRREGRTRFYYPDLQVVCESNPQSYVFQDSPVLVVEILSPSTRQVDLDEKMQAYLEIPTLQY
ncbi:MAG: Uma2 family endonuclease [Pirellulales bacterium]